MDRVTYQVDVVGDAVDATTVDIKDVGLVLASGEKSTKTHRSYVEVELEDKVSTSQQVKVK